MKPDQPLGEGQSSESESQAQGNPPQESSDVPAEPIRGVDISGILAGWTYNADQINARRVIADDGEERIQVRLDLGILQMHTTGRPDGSRPMGYESLLEYFEDQLDNSEEDRRHEGGPGDRGEERGPRGGDRGGDRGSEREGGPAGGKGEEGKGDEGKAGEDGKPAEFKLSSDDCQGLREEAVQYYHRYVAMMALEDFYGVIRDTTRNLRVLDLCRDHAAEESDQEFLEQFRPYILMVRARALASQAINNSEPKAALHAIDEALDALKQHFDMADEPNAFDMSGEVQMLRSMRDSLVPKLPISPMAELKARLAKAIEQENYELAAILRDELKQMKE